VIEEKKSSLKFIATRNVFFVLIKLIRETMMIRINANATFIFH